MIDINQILEWKKTYIDIFQLEILEQHFVFRAIGREEYKGIILMDLELGEFQEAICYAAVIHPKNLDYTQGIAGIAEIISEGVLDVSGLHVGQSRELLDEYRTEMFNFDYQVDVLIHEAFKEFTLEEIASWSVKKTMYYLSRAEWILTNLKGVQLQMIDDVMQEEEAQQKATQNEEIYPEFAEQFAQQEAHDLAGGEQLADNVFGFSPKKEANPKEDALTEEQVMAMLSATGKPITKPSKDMNEMKPELGWFNYMDELKGEFD
jgi:hypothetical protein